MFEQFLYEARPFFLSLMAIFAPLYAPSLMSMSFAALMLFCMAFVLYWRYENRFLMPLHRRRRRHS